MREEEETRDDGFEGGVTGSIGNPENMEETLTAAPSRAEGREEEGREGGMNVPEAEDKEEKEESAEPAGAGEGTERETGTGAPATKAAAAKLDEARLEEEAEIEADG